MDKNRQKRKEKKKKATTQTRLRDDKDRYRSILRWKKWRKTELNIPWLEYTKACLTQQKNTFYI